MELMMNRKLVLSLAGGAAAVFMAFGAAQAAPNYTSLPNLQTLQESAVQQIHCKWHWHCHRWCSRWGCKRRCHSC
jgi:hypothetical protein